MTVAERWTHHISNLLVGGTGLAYAVLRHLVKPADPFAVVNHPLEPLVQHLHVIVAPLLIFAVGVSWQRHIAARLRRRDLPRYRSGLAAVLALLPMVTSGYLLQTTVDDSWRKAWIVVHLVSSALWLLGYVVHQLQPQAALAASTAFDLEAASEGELALESSLERLRKIREENL